MSDQKSNSGIGFWGLLTIVFITLKLCKVISWWWLWVLLPLWIWIPIGLVYGVFTLLISLGNHYQQNKAYKAFKNRMRS